MATKDPTQPDSVPLMPAGQSGVFFAPMGVEPPPPAGHDDEPGVDFKRYLEALRKRAWLVLLSFAVCGAIAFGWTLRQPKLYQASATLIIDTRTANVLGRVADVVEMGTGGYWANESFYQKEYTVLQSRAVARRAAEKLNVVHDDVRTGLHLVPDEVERERLRAELDPADLVTGLYAVEPLKSGNVVMVTVVDGDPEFTAALANAVSDAYAELNLEKRVEGTLEASTWLEVQHKELEGQLESAEDKLYKFMEDNAVLNASLQSQLDEVLQRLQAFNGRLAEVQAERIKQELNAKALAEVRQNVALIDSLTEVRDAPVIGALKTKLVELRADRSELASRYQEAHPKLLLVDEQIGLMEGSLNKEIDAVLLSLQRRQASLESTEIGLTKAIATERTREARLNKLMLEYERLRREVDTNAKLYDLVATRRKEADLSGALRLNNVSTLDAARVPLMPFKPNLRNNLAIGLLLGLLLGAALAILLDLLDNSIKTQEDVEATLAVPFLGLMPIIESGKAVAKGKEADASAIKERDLYVLHHPKSSPAECARFIRTNLLFMSPDKPLRTLLVTSAGPQEGKTTTAVSLAVTMAQSGSKTLIVDTDMRRPRLHRAFGVSNEVGLSSAIVGDSTVQEAIQATDAPDLDVMVCGPIPPNPAELLHTERFKQIVEELKGRYDRVLFDSPPVGAVTDPVILGTQVDGTVMVLKAQRTTKEAAKRTLRALQDANVPVFGAVLNDVDLSSKRYGGGYSAYYRKYGYYYGESPAAGEA